MLATDWREKGVGDSKKAIDFLGKYKWSSHSDYVDQLKLSPVLQKNFLNDYFVEISYKEDFVNFVKDYDFSTIDSKLYLE